MSAGPTLNNRHTALVLEDNPGGRFVLRAILERRGFLVLESDDGEQAVRIAEQHSGPIHLLITDVVLRTAAGAEVIQRLKTARPAMAVLFVSGFPLEQLLNRGLIEAKFFKSTGARFLQKPFSAEVLMQAVEQLMTQRDTAE